MSLRFNFEFTSISAGLTRTHLTRKRKSVPWAKAKREERQTHALIRLSLDIQTARAITHTRHRTKRFPVWIHPTNFHIIVTVRRLRVCDGIAAPPVSVARIAQETAKCSRSKRQMPQRCPSLLRLVWAGKHTQVISIRSSSLEPSKCT